MRASADGDTYTPGLIKIKNNQYDRCSQYYTVFYIHILIVEASR